MYSRLHLWELNQSAEARQVFDQVGSLSTVLSAAADSDVQQMAWPGKQSTSAAFQLPLQMKRVAAQDRSPVQRWNLTHPLLHTGAQTALTALYQTIEGRVAHQAMLQSLAGRLELLAAQAPGDGATAPKSSFLTPQVAAFQRETVVDQPLLISLAWSSLMLLVSMQVDRCLSTDCTSAKLPSA